MAYTEAEHRRARDGRDISHHSRQFLEVLHSINLCKVGLQVLDAILVDSHAVHATEVEVAYLLHVAAFRGSRLHGLQADIINLCVNRITYSHEDTIAGFRRRDRILFEPSAVGKLKEVVLRTYG